ncbi:hypothetical protein CMQ_1253 [Grosmannia clavigera kw1407]|uniref:Uncharacterized protein n=1 Tax=Grosmannia clavigera (strain kw1407 / UAMH 11150) TaxID=655863 RepID=F0XF57_GROCL|nr:uncharacterized protein CMQ_1253 [Grosmannia clavigera kw1407]EFX04325.1 hypothetical protein CMQ_1253 [Grosmannia clavigera kw1407]
MVTQSLVDFYSAYKNQKADIEDIIKRLDKLCGVLETFRSLTDRKFRNDEKNVLKNIENSVEDYEEFINELREEAQKLTRKPADTISAKARTVARKAAYPFRQSTLRKLEESIDEAVSHLSLALQTLQQKSIDNIQNDLEDT